MPRRTVVERWAAALRTPGTWSALLLVNDLHQMLITWLRNDPLLLKVLSQNPNDLCSTHVTPCDVCILDHVDQRRYDLVEEAVARQPFAVSAVDRPSLRLRILAVSQDGTALAYIKEQTPELCWIAIKQTPNALQYVRQPTEEMRHWVRTRQPFNQFYINVNPPPTRSCSRSRAVP